MKLNRSATQQYVYLAVDCRTPDCTKIHILKYLGERGNLRIGAEVAIPAPLRLRCPGCGLNHDYLSTDIRRLEYAQAPPDDFKDII